MSICISLAVVHVFSDMQSAQVSSYNKNGFVMKSIESLEQNFLNRNCFTSGFGIAHLGKSIQNHPRNNTMTNNGLSYSVVIITSLWNKSNNVGQELRSLITPRCMYGKDRQDDQNCYKLCSPSVIHVLSNVNLYLVQRFPETILRHKKEALNHGNVKSVTFMVQHPIMVFFTLSTPQHQLYGQQRIHVL